MESCKRKCYWNYGGTCCPEDKESYNNAKPNNNNCPTYLRPDFDEHLLKVFNNIEKLVRSRNITELEEIEKFIINQRENS
jgi:hypothetical protein